MILKKLRLKNFRQFKGEQALEFAQSGSKNVTVIHAENGFGKTALLNALHWVFWGKLTPDVSQPGNLITECLLPTDKPNELEASVEIHYIHEEIDYILKRSITYAQCQHNFRKTTPDLRKVESGNIKSMNNPESMISNQIPEAMGEFFFFNGENLNQLANEGKAPKLKEAIYNVLGLELLESAIEKTKAAGKALTDEFNSHADKDGQKLVDDLSKFEEQIEDLRSQSELFLENRDALIGDNTNIGRKLEATEESRAAQKRRNDLENHLDSIKQELVRQESSLIKLISEKSYYLFSSKLTERGEEIVKRLEEEGKIPAKFTVSALEKVLECGKCICDSDLSEGTSHFKAIKKLISQAADRSLDDATQSVKTTLTTIQSNYQSLKEEFSKAKSTSDDLVRRSQELSDEIKVVSRKIGSSENLDVQNLELTRQENENKIQNFELDAKRNEDKIAAKQEYVDQYRAMIAKAEQSSEKAKLIQSQISLSNDAVKTMEAMLEAERNELRKELNSEIKKHFEKMIIKDFQVDLDEKFLLRVLKPTSSGKMREVARSTGEKQMTSLVFIASLIGLARRRKDIPTILEGLWGGDLPMVMDSPYGQLGVYYRGVITKWLPSIAPQVAIFVSDSQWRGEVESALDGRIGSEYILEYHASSLNSLASESSSIRGTNHKQFFEDKDEFTVIKEI